MSLIVNEHTVSVGEHIANVRLTVGEVTKVIFDKAYYYFYLHWNGGGMEHCFVRVKDIPEYIEETLMPKDGTLEMDPTKNYINTFHETYSNYVYLYLPTVDGVNGGADITIIGTNNKNVNY